jgi:hypothetical protein
MGKVYKDGIMKIEEYKQMKLQKKLKKAGKKNKK